MNQSITSGMTNTHSSPRASLAAIGALIRQRNLFDPVRERVTIAQKTVQHTPTDKLYDALIAILAGAHGMVEVNTRLRSDVALQRAFGRAHVPNSRSSKTRWMPARPRMCSSWSRRSLRSIASTARATATTISSSWQVLDVDMSGMPCGKKAAFASHGYFARDATGAAGSWGACWRVATTKWWLTGSSLARPSWCTALPTLVMAAERTPGVGHRPNARRPSCGSMRGRQSSTISTGCCAAAIRCMAKDYSSERAARWRRACALGGRPTHRGASSGLGDDARRATLRPAGGADCGALPQEERAVGRRGADSTIEAQTIADPDRSVAQRMGASGRGVLLAYVYCYDQRGGGVETALKEDKQGLGITKRNKKRFEAQQMVTLLGSLAHNLIVWARRWLQPEQPKLRHYGIKRMVRDVLQVSGTLVVDGVGHLVAIILNQAAPLARGLVAALRGYSHPRTSPLLWAKLR